MPGIYLRHGDSYTAMTGQSYESEGVLQDLIAQHPEMLAGEDPGRPALLLVKREAPIQAEQDSGISLDHLYLDESGVPTLVEVKQGANREIRRQIVGQLLDYAAHARGSLSTDRMQEWLEDEANRRGTTAETLLAETLDVDDPDSYWATVASNLDAERFRLVFVSDQIPPSLRRIIEFLSEHTDIDVLGIEVSQYTDGEGAQQIIVPRFVGETEGVREKKRGQRRRRRIDRDALLSSYASSEDKAAALALLDWATARPDLDLSWGTAGANIGVPGRVSILLRIRPSGKSPAGVQVMIRNLKEYDSSTWNAERCDQLIQRLETSTALDFEDNRTRPKASIAPLADPHNRQSFCEIIEEVVRSLSSPA